MPLPLTTCLTPNRIKLDVYARDPDFVRALALMRARWGASGKLRERLWNCAALLLRPDAIAGRNGAAVLRALRQHGLIPLLAKPVALDSARTAALWRYQANVSTADRLDVLDRLMRTGPSLFVVLRDDRPRRLTPATVHLTYLKGPTLAARRKPGHLRSLAGPALANLISYIHASDDPADLVREMGLLFDDPTLRDMLAAIDAGQDRTAQACRHIAALEAHCPEELCLAGMAGATLSAAAPWHGPLTVRQHWEYLIARASACQSFIGGETYDTSLATVPDDKRLSLPLERHLAVAALGLPS